MLLETSNYPVYLSYISLWVMTPHKTPVTSLNNAFTNRHHRVKGLQRPITIHVLQFHVNGKI